MPTNTHIYEAKVIRDTEFLQTVEAAMMQVALEVHGEPADTPGYENRAHIAVNVFTDEAEAVKFARFFAWLALFNPTIRGQVFQPTLPESITPANIDGAALRALIKGAWNVAANVGTATE